VISGFECVTICKLRRSLGPRKKTKFQLWLVITNFPKIKIKATTLKGPNKGALSNGVGRFQIETLGRPHFGGNESKNVVSGPILIPIFRKFF